MVHCMVHATWFPDTPPVTSDPPTPTSTSCKGDCGKPSSTASAEQTPAQLSTGKQNKKTNHNSYMLHHHGYQLSNPALFPGSPSIISICHCSSVTIANLTCFACFSNVFFCTALHLHQNVYGVLQFIYCSLLPYENPT